MEQGVPTQLWAVLKRAVDSTNFNRIPPHEVALVRGQIPGLMNFVKATPVVIPIPAVTILESSFSSASDEPDLGDCPGYQQFEKFTESQMLASPSDNVVMMAGVLDLVSVPLETDYLPKWSVALGSGLALTIQPNCRPSSR